MDSMRAAGWQGVGPMGTRTVSFFGSLVNRADWHNSAAQCADVQRAVNDLAQRGLWYEGNHEGKHSEYFAVSSDSGLVGAVVFDRPLSGDEVGALEALLHEAGHHAGYGHSGTFSAYDAEDCARLRLEDDEDDDEVGTTTCTEETYTYTELTPVWTQIEVGTCVGVGAVRWPGEDPSKDEDLHCTPAVWGYVMQPVERTGTRTVCVTTSGAAAAPPASAGAPGLRRFVRRAAGSGLRRRRRPAPHRGVPRVGGGGGRGRGDAGCGARDVVACRLQTAVRVGSCQG